VQINNWQERGGIGKWPIRRKRLVTDTIFLREGEEKKKKFQNQGLV
jgi:hypothetical protein